MALIEAKTISILNEIPKYSIFREYIHTVRDWVYPFKDIPSIDLVYGYISDVIDTDRYNLKLAIILELDQRLKILNLQNLKITFTLAIHDPYTETWFTRLYEWERYTECYIVLSLIHPNYGRSDKFKNMMNKLLNMQIRNLNMNLICDFVVENYGENIYDYYYDWIKEDEYPDRSINNKLTYKEE